MQTYEERFECLRDYINENSHSVDAANIGGLAGATDFLPII
ncbi:MAG: hypothetical protein Q9M97_00035 [Candidatus Gracilibacteria bacterium]|nr:hypothetical protein [Candidatus Gracilibacteria bacterium]